jgi:hypothetical protein
MRQPSPSTLRRTPRRLPASMRAGLALHNLSMRVNRRRLRLFPMLSSPLSVRNMLINWVGSPLCSNLLILQLFKDKGKRLKKKKKVDESEEADVIMVT